MIKNILKTLFKDSSTRKIEQWKPLLHTINNLESDIATKSDDELRTLIHKSKEKIHNGAQYDDVLPEVFAIVRETAKRHVNMRHFDVQILGGIALHKGMIAEMKTGEGKTLVATLPIVLNALDVKKGIHVVTVNDYLAKRDAEWMGPVYTTLGLTVGINIPNMNPMDKKKAYENDIVYGTNNEFGFDYLRDNMASNIEMCAQGNLNYAIIDEVDSILIDESRTPLIISGAIHESTQKYQRLHKIANKLEPEKHYTMDEKNKHIALTEDGIKEAENLLNIEYLYDIKNMDEAHMLVQSLKAKQFFHKDVDYVIKEKEIIIVDEFTGRLMEGRRYSEGLHQSIEAKENVPIKEESQTLASITFQNYFRLYDKLAGMTGTALTEESEFNNIYKLDTIAIPTNKPMIRKDHADVIYKNKIQKYKAIINEIVGCHDRGQPVLVGTIAIETSELISDMLKQRNIPHSVLNAKYHAKEAEIIAEAGQKKNITIATNMAGRGTDIVLGNGITDLGGLHVIGTERHESRRIDNQLRGRSGRQGDPGSSRFYIALDDDLMRIFGGQRIATVMNTLNAPEDTEIQHPLISRQIGKAQKKVEEYHFSIRKQLLQYDDVMNKQREGIYGFRRELLKSSDLTKKHEEIFQRIAEEILSICSVEKPGSITKNDIAKQIELAIDIQIPDGNEKLNENQIIPYTQKILQEIYNKKRQEHSPEIHHELEKYLLLQIIDKYWIEHLHTMDTLREGIGLRAYGQKDPLIEYKLEGFNLFNQMMSSIYREYLTMLFKSRIVEEGELEYEGQDISTQKAIHNELNHFNAPAKSNDEVEYKPVRTEKKVGRNEPCPCGSGKKYKKCCGVEKGS
ncbi:preprotein translocase subunit SecA [Candidatus Margulisiibacteriota bacterium]